MSNAIRLFENLKDMYLRYLDSPFDLRYDDEILEGSYTDPTGDSDRVRLQRRR